MKWSWRAEDAVPTAMGVLGLGDAARALLAKLGGLPAALRTQFTVTAHQDLLVVTGRAESLPWIDGARYIASRTDAPGLWLPTTERPDVPLDLLATAIGRLHPQRPVLLWPEPAQLVPLQRLLPATDAVLDRINTLWSR